MSNVGLSEDALKSIAKNENSSSSSSSSSESNPSNNSNDSRSPSSNNDLEDLPVANTEVIETGEEVIIDGVIVSPSAQPKRRHYVEYFLLFITITIICVVIIVFTTRRKTSEVPQKDESLSPSSTITLTPTANIEYWDLVKQIAIPISGEDKLNDPESLQFSVMVWLAKTLPNLIEHSVLQINETERIAERYTFLVCATHAGRIFHSMEAVIPPDGPLARMDLCVLMPCNANGQIISIILRNEWHSGRGGGMIATEIGTMSPLSSIIFTRSAMLNTIPTEIGNLTNLRVLNLRGNILTGTIPTELGQLQNLEVLLLDGNLLEGAIPSELGRLTKLEYLGLSQNRFTGSIPSDLAALDNVISVALGENSLVGSLDILCGNNFTNGSSVLELNDGRDIHPYDVDLGLTISCNETEERVECSCCYCVGVRDFVPE